MLLCLIPSCDLENLGWSLRILISNKLLGNADSGGHTLRTDLLSCKGKFEFFHNLPVSTLCSSCCVPHGPDQYFLSHEHKNKGRKTKEKDEYSWLHKRKFFSKLKNEYTGLHMWNTSD